MRTMITVLVGLAMTLGLAGSASAAVRYPATPPGASVSATAVEGGGTVTFSAGRFGRGTTVTVTVRRGGGTAAGDLDIIAIGGSRLSAGVVVVQSSVLSSTTVVADSAGSISVPVALPRAEGEYEIVASGVDAAGNPRTVTAAVLVSDEAGSSGTGSNGASGSPSAALARTGVDNVATVAWAGFGVLVLGGLLVTVASGRRRTRDLQDA